MAKGFEKLNINSAVKSRSRLNLSQTHLTTLDFGQIIPIYHRELIVGDSFDVKYNLFSRIAPLNFPVYGQCDLRTVNLFVPYYQVADDIEGFFQGQKTYHGSNVALRYFSMLDLFNMFNQSSLSTSIPKVDSDGNERYYDFFFYDSSGNESYRLLNYKGRYLYKIFRSLGYDIPQNVDLSSSVVRNTLASKKLNLLPLLSFIKAYNDWMTNSIEYNTSVVTRYLQAIRFKDASVTISGTSTAVCGTNGKVAFEAIEEMLLRIRLLYDSDYFTSAWKYPNTPLDTYASQTIRQPNIDLYDGDVSIGSGNTQTSISFSSDLSAFQLNVLRAFDNFVRRNNYAGSRAVNAIYARFGIKPTEFRAQYADLISKDSIPLQVGDVTQTSQTNPDAPLGSYAGKGIANGEYGYNYKANDYGMLFTLAYIHVKPYYFRGFERTVLKTDPLEFYTPEFDGVGPEPISFNELTNDPRVKGSKGVNNGDITFGFTERYNDYRFGRDQITGDFAQWQMFLAWHFGRNLSSIRANNLTAQSTNMLYYIPDEHGNYEYDRIFAVQNSTSDDYVPLDHFYMTCQFQVNAVRPMKNLSQAVDLGDGDLTVDRLGQQIP